MPQFFLFLNSLYCELPDNIHQSYVSVVDNDVYYAQDRWWCWWTLPSRRSYYEVWNQNSSTKCACRVRRRSANRMSRRQSRHTFCETV